MLAVIAQHLMMEAWCDGIRATASHKAVQRQRQLEQTGHHSKVVLNKFDIPIEKYGSYGNCRNYGNYRRKR